MAATKKKGNARSTTRTKPKRDDSFAEFVLEQLAPLGGVRSKSMFGARGLYRRDVFFGIIDDGRFYLRVDEATRPRYEERGMGPFAPLPTRAMKGYYEVPLEVLEDAAELARWAREAVGTAPIKSPASRPAPRSGLRLFRESCG